MKKAADKFVRIFAAVLAVLSVSILLFDAGYNADIDEIVEAKGSDGSALGYVVTVTSHEAYSGDLQLAMGVRADGTTNGISFLSLSETAGLGMEADTDSFKSQFASRRIPLFPQRTRCPRNRLPLPGL